MSLRDWEKWWQANAAPNFLRTHSGPEFCIIRETMFKTVTDIVQEVGESVLDVGCASCVPYPYFKEKGIKYTGLDLTKKFLDHAKELYPEIDVCHGNIIDGIYPDNTFDAVICINTFVNFSPEEYHDILNQLIRIASKQVLIVFEKEPWDDPMAIKKGEYFYTIRFNKDDLVDKIGNNEKVRDLEIINLVDGEAMRSETVYKISLTDLDL